MRAPRVPLPSHLLEAASDRGDVRVRDLGTVAYAEAWGAMRRFTTARGPITVDQVWLLDHPPVYTLGLNGKPIHVLDPGTIPVLRSDRGGQVTYHGPGQLMVYVLVDLARRGLGLRRLVYVLEQTVIDLCAGFGVEAERRAGAPGVYAEGAKLAALGLRGARRYAGTTSLQSLTSQCVARARHSSVVEPGIGGHQQRQGSQGSGL